MKFLIVFALALSAASAFRIVNSKLGITNGNKAAVGQFSYQVGIYLDLFPNEDDWCGGSLIGNKWVLTAAHCTDGVRSVTVYLGATERTKAEIKYTVSPSDIITYAGFKSEFSKDDISLIKIPATTYTTKIQAVKLPAICSTYSDYTSEKAVATGWGFIADSSTTFTNDLQWARVVVITNDVCARHKGFNKNGFTIISSNLCVSTPDGASPCHGDSGGPLVLESNIQSNPIQIGVTSFGDPDACTKGYPVAFTRVTSYLDWIKDKTGIFY